MKEAREVLTEHILKTEATWNVYPTADSILEALNAAGYEIKQKKCQCGTWGGCELPGHPPSSSTKAQR